MSIILVGFNHKTAPIEVRERFAFTDERARASLQTLVDNEKINEGLIISTCNRVEVLAALGHDDERLGSGTKTEEGTAEGVHHINRFFSSQHQADPALLRDYSYTHVDEKAVRHVFRVASSLDSMVVGEPQVLGQMRHAYSLAVAAGTAGRVLHRLVHHAFRVAKRVRNETGIASSAVSISYTAVELGKKIFDSLEGHTILLVGAGEMAELAAKHLVNAGAKKILIANRTYSAAQALADKFSGEAIEFSTLNHYLREADIVICSTGATEGNYVITKQMAQQALSARRNRQIFFIDISVPRNVDPAIGDIDNLFVFDIDDLESVVASNIRERKHEAQRAELIVEAEVAQFQQALNTLNIGPTVGALRQRIQSIVEAEFARYRRRLGPLTPEQEKIIESMLDSITKKVAHPVISRLRESYQSGDTQTTQAWLNLFSVEEMEEILRKTGS